jgi:hypothetical protein
MDMPISRSGAEQEKRIDIEAVAGSIAATQLESGEIPWTTGQKTDPWDHTEAAMGLTIGGHHFEARAAYRWLAAQQLEDGSWYTAYLNGEPIDKTRDSNLSAYIAVGVWHDYLATGDLAFLEKMWPAVSAAMEFVSGLQTPEGEIHWAINPAGEIDRMALLTGCSSIYMSLKCAIAVAGELGRQRPAWRASLELLGDAIRNKPHLFNMTKSRYSMDWYYPVLCGALTGDSARKRIEQHWKKFVIEAHGVRCVSDEAWVTIAETCELVLALAAIGNFEQGRIVFNWIADRCFEDGSYWCGFTCPELTVWPEDQMSWTNAVALMAADALYQLTPAATIFSHAYWRKLGF